jgi:ribosomal subunit interface protein
MGFTLTDPIFRHVEAGVESALAPVARWVLSVTVRLDDVNSARGGRDKRCRLVVNLRGRRGVIVAQAVDNDLYAAIDKAAKRLRRSAVRAVTRRVLSGRKDPQRPGALVPA